MSQVFGPLPCLIVLAALAGTSGDALATTQKQSHGKKTEAASPAPRERKAGQPKTAELKKEGKKTRRAEHVAEKKRRGKKDADDKPAEKAAPELTGDLAVVKDAIGMARQGKTSDAIDAEKTIADPAGQKLVEWFLLRHPDSQASFDRYATFIAANPDWPGVVLLRRRAEGLLWDDKIGAATVHAFTSDQPVTAKGRLALARVLLGEGDRDGAERLVQTVFRSEELSERTESDVIDAFRDLLGREDYQARMDMRIGAKDFAAAMRAAHHLDDDAVSIVKACSAVKGNDDHASDDLDSVATAAREDLGYVLCRAQWLMKNDKVAEAARLILAAPKRTMTLQDTDEWWRVRRGLARKLLDQGDVQNAYEMVRDAAPPASEGYRADSHFMPGWIALRYLDDANAALSHFAHIDEGCKNPITLARAAYWRGRANEALGDKDAMRAEYEAAASHSTAYYGQLARARLGLNDIELRTPPQGDAPGSAAKEIVHAEEMLYAIGDRDAAILFAADLAGESTDVPTLAAVADVTGRNNDARAMLELGKTALGRGLPLDAYAFPTIGIPEHDAIGPAIDRSIIYSVARTESAFNQKDRSSASAVGLMQVTPEAGRDTAKRFHVEYDWDRMVSDPVYNTQMGAAEVSALLREYKGNYLMTFAGYNAGRGRVRDWIKAYGDPRDPNVDAVDWAERIPFAETRNYVQRVMENLLVYQHRFDGTSPAIATIDHRAPAAQEAASAVP
ncbi:MAG TPA: lytic transglycosylase domain-containing protein [Bradyrhizobium sp.]|uniref:lytic transglycosylase domain-containing protein n=1 Tax=Bradyrhizobium sp. TaxID=376 RepID=UPI002BAB7015|nr:lytic transglycosylase domain-containing protein [Bradyrhizobium sp.]HLZ05493.1 lytic transglycosylase domain-containing protein [Bradyrhizobium sp.]